MKINNRFCHNPKTTTLYNSQVGGVVVISTLAYKLSSLPSIVSEYLSSSTLWFYLLFVLVDTFAFVITYLFFHDGGDELLHDDLRYKFGLVFASIFMGFKCLTFFAFSVLFFAIELYVGIAPVIVVTMLIVPVIYLGVKGVVTIARLCEIMVFLILGIIVLNLAFLKADLDIGRNLPVLSTSAKEFFAHSLRYGTWLGNFMPLMFIKVKKKKFPYIPTSFGVTQLLTVIVVMIGVAMYGNAMKIVSNLLIETSGFNQLSTEIGRMEWTALFAVIVMGITEMGFLFYGVMECSVRLTKSKIPFGFILAVVIFLLCTLLPSPQSIADFSHSKIIGGVMTAFSVILPVYFVILKGLKRRENNKNLKEEGAQNEG